MYIPGTLCVTATGAVLSGVPLRIYNLHFITDGTLGIVSLSNGSISTAAGTEFFKAYSTTTGGVTHFFGSEGMLFPQGCFVTNSGGFKSITLSLSKEPV